MQVSADCPANRAVERGLAAASGGYTQRQIRIVRRLAATTRLGGEDAVLSEAIKTIFQALPGRLQVGSTLTVWTRDMAGGDIELGWDCMEDGKTTGPDRVADALGQGRHGDILGLAVRGLEEICRARSADRQTDERRYVFLLPSAMNRLHRD